MRKAKGVGKKCCWNLRNVWSNVSSWCVFLKQRAMRKPLQFGKRMRMQACVFKLFLSDSPKVMHALALNMWKIIIQTCLPESTWEAHPLLSQRLQDITFRVFLRLCFLWWERRVCRKALVSVRKVYREWLLQNFCKQPGPSRNMRPSDTIHCRNFLLDFSVQIPWASFSSRGTTGSPTFSHIVESAAKVLLIP